MRRRTATKQPSSDDKKVRKRRLSGRKSDFLLSGCFDGCWFPTFVHLAAIHCKDRARRNTMHIQHLCSSLRQAATRCKIAKNRLKIRRPLRSWGFAPPAPMSAADIETANPSAWFSRCGGQARHSRLGPRIRRSRSMSIEKGQFKTARRRTRRQSRPLSRTSLRQRSTLCLGPGGSFVMRANSAVR